MELTAPRDDLVRRLGTFELRDDLDEGRTLVGYAAKFNTDTVINSWEGQFVERIAPGAFKRTLRNNGDKIKVLFNHGFDPSIGDKPLGKPKVMREDDSGFWTETPLARTSYNDDLIELLRVGALDGMSFRFSVIAESWEEPKRKGMLPVRTLTEVKLHEFGPVTFPAYAAATAGVRSRDTFDRWMTLPEEKRSAVLEILGTPSGEPGEPTLLDESAAEVREDPDPAAAHSTRSIYVSWQARVRLAESECAA